MSLIVGVVIGAGIYETAPLVFANVSNPAMALAVWVAGGLLSLAGAACYAELASTYPREGGDYVYLTRAFGPWLGFLFGWAQLAVILTGSIGMMAYVFADYAVEWMGLGSTAVLATSAVLVLTLLNVASVRAGTTTQNLLTWLKVIGLGAIVVAGLVAASGTATSPEPARPAAGGTGSLSLAMILVLYTYGGWNDAAFVAAEVQNKRKNIARALLIGTAIITLVYVLVNAAFLFGLGFERAQSSRAIAADLVGSVLGQPGRAAISVLVMISALGAVNALIFTGARVVASLGNDYPGLSRLGRRAGSGSPVWALCAQAAIAVGLIGVVGTRGGRALVDSAFTRLGLGQATWSGHGGFDTLLRCTAPVFWLFFLLTAISLFVLRARDGARERPFRVPLYPFVPLLFAGTCAAMFLAALDYAGRLVLICVPLLLLGVPFFFTRKRAARAELRSQPASSPAQ